ADLPATPPPGSRRYTDHPLEGPAKSSLLGHDNARPTHFGGEVPQLGQTVLHRQHGLGIVDVHAGLEWQAWNGGRINIDQTPQRMIGQQVTTTFGAILPAAPFGL